MTRRGTDKYFCKFSREEDILLINQVAAQPALYDVNHYLFKDFKFRGSVWKDISACVNKPVRECKIRWRSIRDFYNRKRRMKEGKGSNVGRKEKWEYIHLMSFLDNIKSKRRSKKTLALSVKEEQSENQVFQNNVEVILEEEEGVLEGEYDGDDNIYYNNSYVYNGEEEEREMTYLTEEYNENCDSSFTSDKSKKPGQNIGISKKIKEVNGSLYGPLDNSTTDYMLVQKVGLHNGMKINEHPVQIFFNSMAQTVMGFTPALQAEAKLRVCKVITELEMVSIET